MENNYNAKNIYQFIPVSLRYQKICVFISLIQKNDSILQDLSLKFAIYFDER